MSQATVYLNGTLIGFHDKPKELVEKIKERRRQGKISDKVNVGYYADTHALHVNSDKGRTRRPLIVVEDGEPTLTEEHLQKLDKGKMDWQDLLNKGIIEYLDAEEEETAYIARTREEASEEHNYLEVHPSLIMGNVGSFTVFPNHNASPRITMATSMLKQSIGLYQSNFNLRMDTQGYIGYYPQMPLVKSKQTKILGSDKRPAGENLVVAISPFDAYNIEDAIIMNKASIERGAARNIFCRTYSGEERRYPGGQKDRFELPDPEIQGYRGEEEYKYLDDDGIIQPETEVEGDNVLIGKTSPPRFLEEKGELSIIEESRRDDSITTRSNESGVVDVVMLTEASNGNKLVKVKVRSEQIPELGDKFSSRHGQKGVIGLIVPQRDLPFTANGTVPDLIMNPHAVPSRMTVGHIMELLGGKLASMEGRTINATAFEGENYEDLEQGLKDQGFNPRGEEVLYNGKTGEEIKAQIFMGVIYYQKLKHLVSKKIHARGRGPVQMLTRQPTEGRVRKGGLRFGEMERDTLIGHGTSMLLLERLLKESDAAEELICKDCGEIAVRDRIRNKKFCPLCGSKNIEPVEISYAFKLLLDELKASTIRPKLNLTDKTM